MSKKIKVGSDFSGVGAFNQALMRLGITYEEIFACDMDKYARETFIHNYGEPKYFPTNVYEREIPKESLDIYMTSPPCQAFSLAGKRLGKDDKRGILFFNSLEFIQQNKPRFFIFENVKGLLSDESGKTFSEWINFLGGKSVNGNAVIFPYEDSAPYHVYWQVLNAKEHGVPQNRERVFIIGIRDDADNFFSFPPEEHLTKRLKDVLEEEVFEKYFLSDKMLKVLETHKNPIMSNETPDHSGSILASYFKMGGRDQQYIKSNLEKYYLSENSVEKLVEYQKRQKESGNGFTAKFHDTDGLMSAIKVGGGGADDLIKVEAPKLDLNTTQTDGIIIHNIPEKVKVRKHTVDVKALQECLKQHKNTTIKNISKLVGVPLTEAEHWFRTDTYFAIPNPDLWDKIKEVLSIQTTEFDASIKEFVEQDGVFEKSNRVYDENGIAPTMTSTNADERILTRPLNNELPQNLDTDFEQGVIQRGRGNNKGGFHLISPTITTNSFEQNNHLCDGFKIRRLTPRECFRLMDFPDTFNWICSDSQAYKQAGNSIVVGVLAKLIQRLKL